jgi:Fe-S cluster biogenesis protein NfuA
MLQNKQQVIKQYSLSLGSMKNSELEQKIEIALNSMRPFLQADGGDVELVEITKEMEVRLRLKGNCSSCEMSGMTMKAGIENGLKNAIPQITNVVAVN